MCDARLSGLSAEPAYGERSEPRGQRRTARAMEVCGEHEVQSIVHVLGPAVHFSYSALATQHDLRLSIQPTPP